jgi:DNA repair protein RadC
MSKYRGFVIKNPSDLYDLLGDFKNRRQEHFLVVTLNGAHEIIKLHIVSKGLVNRTIVHPRECFYPAIKDNAAAVMFVHNHPSGKTNPSIEDDEITWQLKAAADILGFKMLDHLIIGRNQFYSYRQSGKISKEDACLSIASSN